MSLPVRPRIEIGRIARFWASIFGSAGGVPGGPLPSMPVHPEHQNLRGGFRGWPGANGASRAGFGFADVHISYYYRLYL